jgi:osmotically inducible protein OsmC
MAVRKSEAVWRGNLREGKGTMTVGDNVFEGKFTFASRFEEGEGTNPEELIAAAHAGCFSMALSADLSKAGFQPEHVHTIAKVTLGKVDGKSRITNIHLTSEAKVPGISADEFQKYAQGAKEGCPVSNALKAVDITMDAKLI